MISFETYISQKTSKYKLKNLQTGDKVKYIGKNGKIQGALIPICTFLEFKVISGQVYIKVKEYEFYVFKPEDFIKI